MRYQAPISIQSSMLVMAIYKSGVYGRTIDQPIEGYMFYKSSNEKAVSDSVYLGNLNGPEETTQQKEDKI